MRRIKMIKPIGKIIHEGFLAKANKGRIKMKPKMTGEEVYKSCKELGVYPRINSGVFEGYFDKLTKEKQDIALPDMDEEIWQEYSQCLNKDKKKSENEKNCDSIEDKKTANKTKSLKKIKLLNSENPKRKGTLAFEVYSCYEDGMLLSELLNKHPKAMKDVRWDCKKGFIEIYE